VQQVADVRADAEVVQLAGVDADAHTRILSGRKGGIGEPELPVRIIELVALSKLPAMTREDVALSGRFLRCGHLAAEAPDLVSKVVPGRKAAWRNGALHGARVPQSEPLAIERADDPALVALATERLPSLVERVGAPCQPRQRLLILAARVGSCGIG